MRKSAKKIVWFIIIAIIVVAGIIGLTAINNGRTGDISKVPRAFVQTGTFTVSIIELGIFQAESKKIISAPFEGKILKIVPDGTEVKKDQAVIWLDTEEITDDLENQITQLKSVKMDLESSIASLLDSIKNNTIDAESAEAELEFNRLKLLDVNQRLETLDILKDKNLIPRGDIDEATRRVEAAKLSARSSDFSYQEKIEQFIAAENINQKKLGDIETKGKLSEAKIKDYLSKLQFAEIKAPEDGIFVLTKRWNWHNRQMTSVQEGDVVHNGHVLAEIPDLSSLIIQTQVSEGDISKLHKNLEVKIQLDALGGKVIDGIITSIGRVAIDRSQSAAGELATEEQQDIAQKVFEIIVKPREIDNRVRPGMTTQVSFIIEEIPETIHVPLKSIFKDNDGPYVYHVVDNRYVKVPVTLGKNNKADVIIEGALSPGDMVLLDNPEKTS